MREIKFRAWLVESKEMYNWNPRFFSDMSPVTGWSDEFPNDEQVILMQYTGLHDKNSKELYHKDIIKYLDRLYVMEWHDNLASWFLKPLHGGWHGVTQSDMSLMCEVIGNIYENPELLQAEKEAS